MGIYEARKLEEGFEIIKKTLPEGNQVIGKLFRGVFTPIGEQPITVALMSFLVSHYSRTRQTPITDPDPDRVVSGRQGKLIRLIEESDRKSPWRATLKGKPVVIVYISTGVYSRVFFENDTHTFLARTASLENYREVAPGRI